MRVLLVEDEVSLASAIGKIFEKNKILVDVVNDGIEGKLLSDNDVYDVIILDIMLPGMSGLEILQHIRSQGKNVPVLLLTAKDSTADKVAGLNMGADDYLVKPFVTDELIARVRALGRRPWDVYSDSVLTYADLALNINNGELTIGTKPVRLTSKEAQLMEMFIRNPGITISKEQILDRIWGIESNAMDNSVEIYVHYLRKKMKDSRTIIKTIRGLGYVLKEPDNDRPQ
ncbi:DNA-binding response regulator, OmpR family, contains REC and winged-helix (wHTH) domain [Eubacterium aggregans]|uniref:Stage 0 sporulation protein A homolog n=2 Tax=Eubacterium aggregans TaxID=81409 RepID=A0A1H4B2X3_9FIRM|nr:response regulator transcription factor [Eubacterium aggregans]SEA42404.1 DNA-binding response regulator, OmpR family, contains REC and winged-helix (wHTH) domain [Eubacterium aggregans]